MNKKYIVSIYYFPDYWENFLHHCNDIARFRDCDVNVVINDELAPYGKYIKGVMGSYLSWDEQKYHTLFVLRWI